MLGLREQVERQRLGVGVAVGDQHHVARPGEPVDPDLAEHLPLGLLHVKVAGTDDHVDGRHRLGPVRERGDRLRAAHPVDDRRAGQPAGAEDDRVDLAVKARRRAHGDLLTPATRAVTTPITTVLGYGARPPGTYTAAASTGASRSAHLWPLEIDGSVGEQAASRDPSRW